MSHLLFFSWFHVTSLNQETTKLRIDNKDDWRSSRWAPTSTDAPVTPASLSWTESLIESSVFSCPPPPHLVYNARPVPRFWHRRLFDHSWLYCTAENRWAPEWDETSLSELVFLKFNLLGCDWCVLGVGGEGGGVRGCILMLGFMLFCVTVT